MSVFNWVFFIPFIQLNSAILTCSSNSFLIENRKGECDNKFALITVGILGVGLTLATGNIYNNL